MKLSPDVSRTFQNGSGKTATVGNKEVYYGMEVVVYGRSYWILDARPNGIGFKLYTVDESGSQFNFRTREVTIPEVAAQEPILPENLVIVDDEEHVVSESEVSTRNESLLKNIAAIYPLLHFDPESAMREFSFNSDLVATIYRLLNINTRTPSINRLPWKTDALVAIACAPVIIHGSVNKDQRERLTKELSQWYGLIKSNDRAWQVLKGLYTAPDIARDILFPELPDAEQKPAKNPTTSHNAETKAVTKKPKKEDDAVTEYLRYADGRISLVNKLDLIGFPNPAEFVSKYDHLSFGLAKMNVTNQLRKAVKEGLYTIPTTV